MWPFPQTYAPALSLDTGIVVLANPVLNWYQIRPSITLEEYPQFIDATVLGGQSFSVAGVQQQPTYQVGERVLYVWLTDTLQQQCIAQAVILGKLDVAQAFRSNALQSMFHNGLNYRNTDFYDTHRIQYDRASYIRDFSNSGPIDIWSGDWSVHGKQTGLLLSDDYTGLRAGQAAILLNGLDRRLEETSLLRTVNTIGSTEDLCIVNKSLIYVSKRAGNPLDAYGNGFAESDVEVKPQDAAWTPLYRSLEQEGDILYGQELVMRAPDGKTPVSVVRRGYDGSLRHTTAFAISLEKRVDTHVFEYKGSRLERDDALQNAERNAEEPTAYLQQSPDLWEDGCIRDTWEEVYAFVDENSAQASDELIDVFEDEFGVHKTAANKSVIRQLPDGSIVLRDAWGSEIRMSHGNIQLSSANNLTTIAGRDRLDIVSGVQSIAAGRGIEFGTAEGDVLIKGHHDVKIAGGFDGDGSTTIESKGASGVLLNGNSAVYLSGKDITLISKDPASSDYMGGGSIQLLNGSGPVVLAGSQVQAYGTTGVQLVSNNTALMVSGGQIVAGCSVFQSTGNITACSGDVTAVVPNLNRGTTSTITAAKSYSPSVVVEGGVTAQTVIQCNGPIMTRDALMGDNVYARHPNDEKTLVKLRSNIQQANRPTSQSERISNSLSRISTQISTALSAIDIKSFLSRLFAFTHTSKAYEIQEPVFSAKGSGGTAFTGVTAIDNRSNLTYIYPGEAFWTSSGMTAWTEDWLVGEPPEQTVKAVNGIKLNTPNIT